MAADEEEAFSWGDLKQDADDVMGKRLRDMCYQSQKWIIEGEMEPFMQMKSDFERMEFVLSKSFVHRILGQKLVEEQHEKSLREAQVLHREGTRMFKKGKFDKALDCFIRSSLRVPFGDDFERNGELALILADRSATMFELELWELCLKDVQWALDAGYPKHKAFQLYERSAKCYMNLNRPKEAVLPLQLALRQVERKLYVKDFCKLPFNECPAYMVEDAEPFDEKELERKKIVLIKEIVFNENSKVLGKPVGLDEKVYPQLESRHETYPQAEDKLEASFTELFGKGRFMRARREIQVGSPLLEEQPYVSVLFPHYCDNHCYHCQTYVHAPLPDYKCIEVWYCSPECRQVAWESYHKWEWNMRSLLDPLLCGKVGHLAQRIAHKMGYENIVKFMSKIRREYYTQLLEPLSEDIMYEIVWAIVPVATPTPPPEPSSIDPGTEIPSTLAMTGSVLESIREGSVAESCMSRRHSNVSITSSLKSVGSMKSVATVKSVIIGSRHVRRPLSRQLSQVSMAESIAAQTTIAESIIGEELAELCEDEDEDEEEVDESEYEEEDEEEDSQFVDGERDDTPFSAIKEALLLGLDANGVYSNDYNAIWNMVVNYSRRIPSEVWDFNMFSIYILKVLQKEGFFDVEGCTIKRDTTLNEELVMFGVYMLKNVWVVQCNAHAIMELENPKDYQHPQPEEIGYALYPTAALFNHSCMPNADLIYYNNHVYLQATRNILSGEEITIDYNLTSCESQHVHRRGNIIIRYCFDCTCPACKGDWRPIRDLEEDDVLMYYCQSPSCNHRVNLYRDVISDFNFDQNVFDLEDRPFIRCPKCKQEQKIILNFGALEELNVKYSKGLKLAESGQLTDAVEWFKDYLKVFQEVLAPPYRDMGTCQSAIRQCYRLQGNVKMPLVQRG